MVPPPPPKCGGGGGGICRILQGTFDDLVRGYIEDLGMDPAEVLLYVLSKISSSLRRQSFWGCDLHFMSGEGDLKDNPVMRCLKKLKQLLSELNNQVKSTSWETVLRNSPVYVLGRIWNAAVATRNGALELFCAICGQIKVRCNCTLNVSLKALAPLLHVVQSRALFRDCHGPKTIFGILDVIGNLETLTAGFSVVAMAATANEIFKESYEIKDRRAYNMDSNQARKTLYPKCI